VTRAPIPLPGDKRRGRGRTAAVDRSRQRCARATPGPRYGACCGL